MKMFTMLIAVMLALASCAGPGQPPNAGNLIVGTGEIFGGHVLIANADAKLQSAYKSGKIPYAVYDALYHEEADAIAALDGLGAATIQNKPVTQADVNAALAKFLGDITTLVPVTPIGPELPPN